MPLLSPEELQVLSPDEKRQLRAQRRSDRQAELAASIASKTVPWDVERVARDKRTAADPTDWDKFKAAQRAERTQPRGTIIPPFPNLNRGARQHDCVHTLKHHKQSGRCRRNCKCTAAADREARAL